MYGGMDMSSPGPSTPLPCTESRKMCAERPPAPRLPARYVENGISRESDDGLQEILQSHKGQHRPCKCPAPCRLFHRLATDNVRRDDRIVDLYSARDVRAWGKDCYDEGFKDAYDKRCFQANRLQENYKWDCKDARMEGWEEGVKEGECRFIAKMRAMQAKTSIGGKVRYKLWEFFQSLPTIEDYEVEKERATKWRCRPSEPFRDEEKEKESQDNKGNAHWMGEERPRKSDAENALAFVQSEKDLAFHA